MNEHFYSKVQIENFRGIKSLEIDGFERVNLLVGKNNCGKTSVLESMFLLTGMSNIELLGRIESWRGLILSRGAGLRNLFYGREHERGILLSGKQLMGNRELKISPLFETPNFPKGSGSGNGSSLVQTEMTSSTTEEPITGLKSNFTLTYLDRSTRKKRWYTATMRLEQQDGQPNVNIELDKKYKEATLARFFHSRRELYNANLVDEMLNEKHKEVIVNCLQSIEPKVQDVRTSLNGIVTIDIGLDNFLPINHLGDGTVRTMDMLASIYGTKKGILMIDEIENGLHVSSIKHMWQVVLEHSQKVNTQIFMTTHSHDVIEGLNMALQEKRDSVACFWLNKFADDGIKAYRYAPDELDKALESGVDIRH